MNWIKLFFKKFHKGETANSGNPLLTDSNFAADFTDEQKKQIVDSALTTSSQILISAAVMTNSHNHITGDVFLPDGSKWRLKFERVND